MFLDSTHRIDNSKFKFRLLISSNRYLYYQADRKKDRFLIEIYQRVG